MRVDLPYNCHYQTEPVSVFSGGHRGVLVAPADVLLKWAAGLIAEATLTIAQEQAGATYKKKRGQ